jgi:hypothetical protein
MTNKRPRRHRKVAPEEAKVQFRKSWDAWKAWVELREGHVVSI